MATVSAAAEVIADAFGASRSSVFRGLRALREHSDTLMPEGKAGRYGGAHVSAEHLANALLMIAVPTREPMTEAHTWTERYGSFVLVEERHATSDTTEDAEGQTTHITLRTLAMQPPIGAEAATLRGFLAALIGAMAQAPGMREYFRARNLRATIEGGATPRAAISVTDPHDGSVFTMEYAEPRQGEFFPAEPAATLVRQVHIPFAAFDVLAALCADTEAQRKPTPTTTPCLPLPAAASSSAEPETENAGPLPEGPALIRDHDRDSRDLAPMTGQREAKGVCVNPQPLTSRLDGQPPAFFEVVPHDRRHLSAFAAGA